jgi:bifunctional lysine-specific demethylase and histidyl-hydroxylase NO66
MLKFADFIAPFDPVEFKTQYYGKKPLHIRRQNPSLEKLFPNPLPWTRFNEVLSLMPYWNEETLKVFYKNRLALRENYCDLSNLTADANAPADPGKIKALLGLGASLVANHIHRVCPEVGVISQMLQREFAASSGANAYCSFKQVQAFNTHFDLHDVFAVQAEGEKLWHVYEARADNPILPVPPGDEAEKRLIDSRGKLLFETVMQPGDILYLPRGQYHDAITGSEASLHVTYWVKPATGLSLFKLIESALTAESEFRAFLPDANDAATLKEHLTRLSRHVDRLINSPSFAIDIQNHQRAFAASPAGFELPTQKRPQFYSTTKRGQVVRRYEGFTAVFGELEVPLGHANSAVAWLLTQRIFSFEELVARHPFINEGELQGVLQQLVNIGALVATDMR